MGSFFHGRNPKSNLFPRRTELFNKAYNHISERIDQVYKDLTKGKAAPMGGVAYLSLEDNEVWTCLVFVSLIIPFPFLGAICRRYQVPCHAPHETIPGHGAAFRW
jgi:hypothetical protein